MKETALPRTAEWRYGQTMRDIQHARRKREAERAMLFMGHPYAMRKKLLRGSTRLKEERREIKDKKPAEKKKSPRNRRHCNARKAFQNKGVECDTTEKDMDHVEEVPTYGMELPVKLGSLNREDGISVIQEETKSKKKKRKCKKSDLKKEKKMNKKELKKEKKEEKKSEKKMKKKLKRREKIALKELKKEMKERKKAMKREKKQMKLEKRAKKRARKQRKTILKLQRIHSLLGNIMNKIGKCMRRLVDVFCAFGGLALITLGLFAPGVATAPMVLIGAMFVLLGMLGGAVRVAKCAETTRRREKYRTQMMPAEGRTSWAERTFYSNGVFVQV
ncbi:uncharacterized protein LOC108950431 [Ciona intestinalis]